MNLDQAVNWLDYETPSSLSQQQKDAILAMRSTPEYRGMQIGHDLLFYADQSDLTIDQVEIITHCAVYLYERGRIDEAIGHFERAVHYFADLYDYHRAAMVECILHEIHCTRHDDEAAYDWIEKAFWRFLNRARFYHQLLRIGASENGTRQKNDDRLKWYKERMVEIASKILVTSKTAFDCLFTFDTSSLDPSAAHIENRVNRFVIRGESKLASVGITYLKKVTRKAPLPRETAEGLAFSALKYLEMGHSEHALPVLRRALACCSPAGHDQVFLRWILAMEQIKIESEWCSGIENLEMCIRHIDVLVRDADWQNDFDKRTWYEVYRTAMRGIIDQRLANWTGSVRALPVR